MARSLALLVFAVALVIPSQATVILYSQNLESGSAPALSYGGTMLNTAGIPAAAGLGNWALFNNSGGNPIGTTSNPIAFQLTGLTPSSLVSLQFSFLAIDSWDGIDFGSFSPDYFTVQFNTDVLFQAAFRNWQSTHYSGDGSVAYGSNTPPNSTITLQLSDMDFVGSSANDAVYTININNIHVDSGGNLNIYWYANGAGWQGGADESFGIDNIVVYAPDPAQNPEPGTWLTLSAGIAGLLCWRRRRA